MVKSTIHATRGLYGSKNDKVGTPKELVRAIKKNLQISVVYDPCPMKPIEGWDGLQGDWKSTTFCNPPYSEVEKWVDKAVAECKKGVHSLLLIPARTSSRYWHNKVYPNSSRIWFLSGRIKFVGYSRGLGIQIALVEFDPKKISTPSNVEGPVFNGHGSCEFRLK